MATEKEFRPSPEDEAAYAISRRLAYYRRVAERAEEDFHLAIVAAKDEHGWTFREIGEALGIAHSWVYHLYKRQKGRK